MHTGDQKQKPKKKRKKRGLLSKEVCFLYFELRFENFGPSSDSPRALYEIVVKEYMG